MAKIKFSHFADCHIGSWRDEKLKTANLDAFKKGIDISLEKGVDFIIIAGDLFNTALPSIDQIKEVAEIFRKIKDASTPIYIIQGSHDFSPSGKTMIDVLEKAGLCKNVFIPSESEEGISLSVVTDEKTGIKLAGVIGRKGTLEKGLYEKLDRRRLEEETGQKIFLFHTALTEFKPSGLENMDSCDVASLPKNFNYYAGGHVHYIFEKDEPGFGKIVFPGPTFPNNFKELEELKQGGFYYVELDEDLINTEYVPLNLFNIIPISLDCNDKTPFLVEQDLKEIADQKFSGDVDSAKRICLIRCHGRLIDGKTSDINFKEIFEYYYSKGAFYIMKNTAKLHSSDFKEVQTDLKSMEEIEKEVIESSAPEDSKELILSSDNSFVTEVMKALDLSKEEGEKNEDFNERIKGNVENILNIDL